MVKSGDVVRVKVLEVDIARKRISLTLRLDDEVAARSAHHPERAVLPAPVPARAVPAGPRPRTRSRPTARWPTRCAGPGWYRSPREPEATEGP